MGSGDRLKLIEHVFDREADEWHRLARRYQTRYDEMLGELVLRTRVPEGARILDLGCGSGVLAEIMLDTFPGSELTVLDMSANMIAASARRLERFAPRVTLVEGKFDEMPPGPYDAVVSTLALHHLGSDEEKRDQYRRILNSLTPGGVFWQGEYVLCSTPEDSALNESAWGDWLRGQGFSEEEVADLHERVVQNDRPAPLMDQLRWLQDLGFTRVDCTWRHTKFAVFGGYRPGE